MNIEEKLSAVVKAAVSALYGIEADDKSVQLSATRKEFEGDLTLVVFPFLKASKKKPEETAQEIGDYLVANASEVEKFNVVKGFLNMVIKKGHWVSALNNILADDNFGKKTPTAESPLYMVEYSSPNTNKPLHLGHVQIGRAHV